VIPTHLKGRHFLRMHDWSPDDLLLLLDLADRLKVERRERRPNELLPGRRLGMIFEKPSMRTRVSFEVGMADLGGTAVHLGMTDIGLGERESIRDVALVLSRYVDAIMIRAFRQADVAELAAHASVPVINGLTDESHPCQALADVMTIRERHGRFEGVRVAYLGDGNNVCHSLMVACAKLGVSVVVAAPAGYEPSAEVVEWARSAARDSGSEVKIVRDPDVAAEGAEVLYTDVWTSMGQEDDRERRLRSFEGFTLDDRVLGLASDRAVVMHCLPAHVGEEIAEGPLYGRRSAAWDQAENRLHAQKALLAAIVP
jgi:ornithine carbamoyltransferase